MENIYYFSDFNINNILISPQIRWLNDNELNIFNCHLKLCEQKECSVEIWNKIIQNDIRYCGYFMEDKMIARASVEKYSTEKWEVADVRVVREFRNQGYAKKVCYFVMQYILENKKTPTIRTEDVNLPMHAVIMSLGFTPQE